MCEDFQVFKEEYLEAWAWSPSSSAKDAKIHWKMVHPPPGVMSSKYSTSNAITFAMLSSSKVNPLICCTTLILSSSFDFGCQTSALKNILWTLVFPPICLLQALLLVSKRCRTHALHKSFKKGAHKLKGKTSGGESN